ncbi:MAG: thiamine phosphate synthase [Candidatus Improbicoccus pseudotrichonymphae]|uniref:Thiamine-phosphate synthase n=1 Tax=Candidatus Improbicoccus pseudotrichonymphae TaxID=3033792 RepID=A0AA48KVE7_9FIRM|nr:MAG: thiamine phosphate synthase [Candidatus Improbicoccus pseudotrichonymphae]
MKNRLDCSLYFIADLDLINTRNLDVETCVEQAIAGGCTMVQLRAKTILSIEFFKITLRLREITEKFKVPFIINDHVDIALALNADGVHVGQNDLDCKTVRRIVGEKIVGVSAGNLSESLTAVESGADYLGIGSIFETDTKKDAKLVSIKELCRIREKIDIPIVAIGGINKNNLSMLENTKMDGVAVSSAIILQKDILLAAKELKARLNFFRS